VDGLTRAGLEAFGAYVFNMIWSTIDRHDATIARLIVWVRRQRGAVREWALRQCDSLQWAAPGPTEAATANA
jgi:hypothetical protein